MASDDLEIHDQEAEGPFTNPWPPLIAGLAAVLVGCLLAPMENLWNGLLGLLVVGGLLATGAAVAIRPSSPTILGLAAFASLLGSVATHSRWDSIGMLLAIGAGIAGVAALLMLLPRTARRFVVSLFIVFHFVGILTAVTSVQPAPWISNQLWVRVYRPYLQFMYLNNAYHFYSPDPGPAQQLWFRVAYTDEVGQAHGYWLRFPNRDDSPLLDPLYQEYQRQLSITESTNQFMPNTSLTEQELLLRRFGLRDRSWLKRHDKLLNIPTWRPDERERRKRAGAPEDVMALEINDRQWKEILALQDIPFHAEMPPLVQYRFPNGYSQKNVQSYARHVFRSMEEQHPDWNITGIKIYRVEHRILTAKQMSEGQHPDDAWQFFPYYQGEYDRNGRIKDENDRYLFWLLPIQKVRPLKKKGIPQPELPAFFRLRIEPEEPEEEQGEVLENYLKFQAGDENAKEALPPYKGEWE
jgi:hypothetical protein